jgi:phosphoglycerol transferase
MMDATAQASDTPCGVSQRGWWLDCLTASALCFILLIFVLRLYEADWRVPLQYVHDAVVFLVRTKQIAQGDWIWQNTRIGMPFGADWHDFPMNLTADSAGLFVLTRFTRSPGLALNLYWLIAVSATAGAAAYTLRRLGAARFVAVCTGTTYALLPYVFYRGLTHLHSLYYVVPLVSATAIELCRGRLCLREGGGWKATLKAVPGYAWVGAVSLGLCYAYTVFFGVFVIAAATCLAWLARRSRRDLLLGLLLLGITGVTFLMDMSPALIYWARNGRNPSMSFKAPLEAEVYGLKLRFLLTPTPNHPLPLFRAIEQKLALAGFPNDNENQWARLGTVGSLGFLALLVITLGAVIGVPWAQTGTCRLLGFAAALMLLCILLATVGGFGDFFNTFVSPDIRCYTRIFPFIAFFSILAVALLATGAEQRWRQRGLPVRIFQILLLAMTTASAFDQFPRPGPLPHSDREQLYRADAAFVERIEQILPADSAVFQLPYRSFPTLMHEARMISNDQGRPYIHSSRYRWSWGSLMGSTAAEWSRETAALPVVEMLHRLYHGGFSGLWVDLYGYPEGDPPEPLLTRTTGVMPVRSLNGRYLFYDLRRNSERIRAEEKGLAAAEQLARHPVQTFFERGFYGLEQAGDRRWRWSRQRGRIVFVNPLEIERSIRVALVFNTASTGSIRATAAGIAETISAPGPYQRVLLMPPHGLVALDFSCSCARAPAPGDPREMYFSVSEFQIVDR